MRLESSADPSEWPILIHASPTAWDVRHCFTAEFHRPSGRLPVNVGAEPMRRFPADMRWVSTQATGNRLSVSELQGDSSNYAFSPTRNSTDLKGTPHLPIPQYPFGFFARYCWGSRCLPISAKRPFVSLTPEADVASRPVRYTTLFESGHAATKVPIGINASRERELDRGPPIRASMPDPMHDCADDDT